MKQKTTLKHQLITLNHPKSVISEKFRGIRSNLLFSSADTAIKGIVVTAEKPAAGKSTIASNLAITYAQAGYRTLIIDGDMRKPTLHYIFNKNNNHGLSSAIIKNVELEEAIKETEIENLDLLTSGPIPPNPSELIGSSNFNEIIEILKEQYNFIVLDTPPINTVTDAQIYSKYIKHSILVIDAEKNNRTEIIKAKSLLDRVNSKILGVVLNRMPKDKSSSYYAYYGSEDK